MDERIGWVQLPGGLFLNLSQIISAEFWGENHLELRFGEGNKADLDGEDVLALQRYLEDKAYRIVTF